MKNRFHRRGGWNDDVVVFFYIFNSDVFPVELRIFQEARSRKNPPEKIVSWQGFDEGDRQWRWTDGIQGEVLASGGKLYAGIAVLGRACG